MKNSRKLFALTATFTLLVLTAMPTTAAPQRFTTLLATAHGQGTLKVGREVFKLSNVVVKLKEDGTGEITLITDLQLFVTCTWSAASNLSEGIDLKLTAGATSSAQGTGKLLLRPDGKAIDRLSIEGSSNTNRKILLKFVAD